VVASPFAIHFVQRALFARGEGALRVADSPAGFLVEAVGEIMFFVPLLAFAQEIWRRRSRKSEITPE
jgi:hypothetical protein